MKRFVALVTLAVLASGLFIPAIDAQDAKIQREVKPIDVIAGLADDQVETKDFTTPMMLKDAIGLLYEKFAAKGLDLPIIVDVEAFRRANVGVKDFQDPDNAEVSLPAVPRILPLAKVLRLFADRIPGGAAFIVRDAFIEIVPTEMATAKSLLQQKVVGRYIERPLAEILEDLSGKMGVSITMDAPSAKQAEQKVNATFRNDITLREALIMLTEMAGLTAEFLPSGVRVTLGAASAQ